MLMYCDHIVKPQYNDINDSVAMFDGTSPISLLGYVIAFMWVSISHMNFDNCCVFLFSFFAKQTSFISIFLFIFPPRNSCLRSYLAADVNL